MSILNILSDNREDILLAEFGALLHDADKVSYKYFLSDTRHHALRNELRVMEYYGKPVKDIKTERWTHFFDENPGVFFDIDYNSLSCIDKDVKKIIISNLSSAFVYHHHNDPDEFPLIGAIVQGGICGCDGIDSELDKLDGNDGKVQKNGFKIDSPFGFSMENVPEIQNLPELPLTGLGNNEKTKEILCKFLGETRYPCNDVTLWAHSYSVATLAKATLAKILIEIAYAQEEDKSFSSANRYQLPMRKPRKNENNATDFTFLRVFFDRDYMLSRAQNTSDVLAVRYAIDNLQVRLRDYVSTELLIGNETYHDEEMQLFCVPKLATWAGQSERFKDLHVKFEDEVKANVKATIHEILKTEKLQELPFEVTFSDLSKEKDPSVPVPRRILDRSNLLFQQKQCCRQSPELLAEITIGENRGHGKCEVCGVRYIDNNEVRNPKDDDDKDAGVCTVCKSRRASAGKNRHEWIKEEADGNDQDSQKLLYTTDLNKCLNKEKSDNKLVLISVSFDIEAIRSGKIFENVIWGSNPEKQKNPSPGRLYRCWETLRSFFEGFMNGFGVEGQNIRTLNGGQPVFHIVNSPRTLQFVASACNATRIINDLYRDYETHFGKFRASLPMSIGCIFFHDKFPLYVVLEAAKLMRGTLAPAQKEDGRPDSSDEKKWLITGVSDISEIEGNEPDCLALNLKTESEGRFGNCAGPAEWRIQKLLSDGDRKDDYHPRFKTSTIVKNVDDLVENDQIFVRDGHFDFILLDSAVRRFDILPDGIRNHAYGKRPAYPLSAWKNFEKLRELLSMLNDTQVKSIEGALTDKMRAWREEWHETKEPWKEGSTIRNFCEATLFSPNVFGNKETITPDDRKLLIGAAVNGMLLDAIDFYVRLTGTLKKPEPGRSATHLDKTDNSTRRDDI